MQKNTMWLIVIVLVIFILGGASLPRIDISQFDPLAFLRGDSGLENVSKPVDFVVMNKYAGSNVGTVSNGLKVYDSNGKTLLETLSIGSDGTIATSYVYESGKQLYVQYINSNSKHWFPVTVPQMNPKDAESATVNTVRLDTFSNGTYNTDTLKFGGTTIADAGSYNFTASGTTQSFTYSLANTGADNTGLISSYDPLYEMKWSPVLYVTFSGTGYEKVLVYGFSNDFVLGTTHWVANELDDYALTKHKEANIYKSYGTQDFTFTLDGTGYSGTGTTMQIYVYMYADPSYTMNHGGAFGTEALLLAEQTVTLQS